jgi:hypothetical protein
MDACRLALLPGIVVVWSLVAANAHSQTTLRYKFKEGEKFEYALDTKTTMSMSIQDKSIDMTMTQTARIIRSIQNVDEKGNAKVKVTFGRNKITMDSLKGKVEVDSQDAQEPDDAVGKVLFKVVQGMASLEITGILSATGEFSDISIPKNQLAPLQNIPGGQEFGDLFSEAGLKRMMSQSGLIMPKEAVNQGATWKDKTETKLPVGKMTAEIEFTYAGSVDSLAKIELKPKATLEPNPDSKIVMTLKAQEGKGTAYFDQALGRLLEVTTQHSMDMEAKIGATAFTQRLVQTMTMKLVDKK